MKKLGILLDSFCGHTKKEIEAFGFDYVNMIAIFDGKEYKDGIDLNLKDKLSYELLVNANDIKTSMPAIGVVVEKLEEMQKKYEKIIYFTINKGFSSTFSTATAVAADMENVHVISNKLVSTGIIAASQEAVKMANDNKDIDQILKMFQTRADDSMCFVIPSDATSLIKSGRLTGIKKMAFEKLKLIPALLVTDDGFSVSTIKRNFVKVIKNSIEKAITKIGRENMDEYTWEVIHCGVKESKNKVISAFKDAGIKEWTEAWAALSIVSHTGIGAIGIFVRKKESK